MEDYRRRKNENTLPSPDGPDRRKLGFTGIAEAGQTGQAEGELLRPYGPARRKLGFAGQNRLDSFLVFCRRLRRLGGECIGIEFQQTATSTDPRNNNRIQTWNTLNRETMLTFNNNNNEMWLGIISYYLYCLVGVYNRELLIWYDYEA